jgi:hypothetical protein
LQKEYRKQYAALFAFQADLHVPTSGFSSVASSFALGHCFELKVLPR